MAASDHCDKRIKVLHIIRRWRNSMNGEKAFIVNAASALPGDMYTQTVLSIGPVEGCKLGLDVHGLLNHDPDALSLFCAAPRVRNYIKQVKPSVVHIHGNNNLCFLYAEKARRSGVPVRIVHSHNSSLGDNGLIKVAMNRFLARYKGSATDLVACSKEAGDWLFENRPYEIIRNGIDVNRFKYSEHNRLEVRKKWGIPSSAFVIGHVGTGVPVKNACFIIDVFDKMRADKLDVHLLLIGTGDEIEKVKNRAKQSESERIHFVGTVGDIYRYYSAMDAFMLPSFYEGLPICLIEAQTNGLPCLVSDTVSPEAALSPSFNRISLKKSTSAWSASLKMLVDRTMALRKDPKAGQIIRNAGFDIPNLGNSLEQLYRQ